MEGDISLKATQVEVKEYNTIVRQWGPHLLRFANHKMKNRDLAKDIVQDAFEVLWSKKDEIQAEKAKQFLFTVVYRKGMDVYRRDRNDASLDESHENVGDGFSFEKQYAEKEHLQIAIDRLPAIQQQLVLLRDLEGYNYDEIGAISGLSESQVKVYLFRARKTLKETITKMEAL